LQQNLEKTTKNWSEVHALFFGLTSVSWTWESHVWKEFRLEHLKSDIVRIQDPKSKTFKKLFLDPGQASWVQIQDPRSTILKTNFCWIQGRILGSDFCPGSKKSFFQNLGSWIRGPWDPKSDSCSDLKISSLPTHLLSLILVSDMYMYMYMYMYTYVYVYVYVCVCVCVCWYVYLCIIYTHYIQWMYEPEL
jgi:hypothetical protein